jgi:hypothetical protein
MNHHIYTPPSGGPIHCEFCPCKGKDKGELQCHVTYDTYDESVEDWAYCREISSTKFFFYNIIGMEEEIEEQARPDVGGFRDEW